MTRAEAKQAFALRIVQSVLPLLLGLAFFYYMWWPDSVINPLTWAMFHDTYAVYSVAGAIAATAILVTVTGTLFYITFDLFGSLSANKARPRPLLIALLMLILAILSMFAPVLLGYFSSNDLGVNSADAIRRISWFFLASFVLFCIADHCTLSVFRDLSTQRKDHTELKHAELECDVRYARDSIWFIDVPVILSIAGGLMLEHFVDNNAYLIQPSEGRPNDSILVALEGMLLGLSLGGIALHVIMSQIIFLLLNFRCALEKYNLATGKQP